MTDVVKISGRLSKKDLKRLTRTTRSGTVGPTTVYYAGVTAPIISAGVAVFARSLMHDAQFISAYWLFFISTLIAAFAGICWYLIFMRWSYRNSYGRGDEAISDTTLKLTDAALVLQRNHITTIIAWPAVLEVQENPGFLSLVIADSNTVLIPDHWFGTDNRARDAFHTRLNTYIQS